MSGGKRKKCHPVCYYFNFTVVSNVIDVVGDINSDLPMLLPVIMLLCKYEIQSACYLAGVLASLQVAGTEHVGSDLTRIGVFAAGVTNNGSIQAPQSIRIVC